MKKVFLDTNVFLRFFIPTDAQKHKTSKELVSYIEEGLVKAYTSNVVFLECYYVLVSFYKTPRDQVFEIFTRISDMRNITIVEKTDTKGAIALWKETGVKFTDCLIATQVGKGIVLCTYDTEFKKFSFLTSTEPGDIVKKIHTSSPN